MVSHSSTGLQQTKSTRDVDRKKRKKQRFGRSLTGHRVSPEHKPHGFLDGEDLPLRFPFFPFRLILETVRGQFVEHGDQNAGDEQSGTNAQPHVECEDSEEVKHVAVALDFPGHDDLETGVIIVRNGHVHNRFSLRCDGERPNCYIRFLQLEKELRILWDLCWYERNSQDITRYFRVVTQRQDCTFIAAVCDM